MVVETFINPIVVSLTGGKLSQCQWGQDGGVRLASALIVIGLIVQYENGIKCDAQLLNILCQALLLKRDGETCTCSEYDALMNHHVGPDDKDSLVLFLIYSLNMNTGFYNYYCNMNGLQLV